MAGNRRKDGPLLIEEDLTVVNAAKLRDRFVDALGGKGPLLLDLSKVGEMDTAGFQLLTAFKHAADDAGREFSITAHSPVTLSILKLYAMETYFGVDADALGILGGEGIEEELGPELDSEEERETE